MLVATIACFFLECLMDIMLFHANMILDIDVP